MNRLKHGQCYFGTQTVYFLLLCILLLVLLWELILPDWNEPYKATTANVFETMYASRIRRLIYNSMSMSSNTTKRMATTNKRCSFSSDYITNNRGDILNLIERVQSLRELARRHVDVMGGAWRPSDCIARHRVAIVIPYRDRKEHLVQLLSALLPFLKAQQLDFRIYLAEQDGNLTYNKGVLMNAAVLEALKDRVWDCFVFHDVDLVPRNIRILYSCPPGPRHLSAVIDEFQNELPYDFLVGGVLVLRTEDYEAVNGFSNVFWGWGGEDDDMYYRIKKAKLRLERLPYTTARYHQIEHAKRKAAVWKIRYKNLQNTQTRMRTDGVNSVDYKLVSRTDEPLFVHLLIDVGEPPSS